MRSRLVDFTPGGRWCTVRPWFRPLAVRPWFHRSLWRSGVALLALLLALGVVLPVQAAGGPFLIRDINTQPNPFVSSDPKGLVAVGTVVYFVADDHRGQELWKSDGTEVGTVLVRDILPGGSSNPDSLTNVNGTLFFTAHDGKSGHELWKSDGTAAGTVRVKDINPGLGTSSPNSLTNVNGTLFFSAHDGIGGAELWKSNGTAAGTVRVKDINPGGNSSPGHLTNVNGTFFFIAHDGSSFGLWKSNGTEVGTLRVPGYFDPRGLLVVAGSHLFFPASNVVVGTELWALPLAAP